MAVSHAPASYSRFEIRGVLLEKVHLPSPDLIGLLRGKERIDGGTRLIEVLQYIWS